MRFLLLVLLMFSLFFINKISAQIPNAGFEQWSSGNPDGWWTSNYATPNVTQSTDAHSGSYAVRGEVINTQTGTLIPIIISGIIGGHGFPISVRYANLTGYYKLNVVTTENLSVLAIPFKNGQVIGVGGSQFFAASSYTLFTVPIYYSNGETPDSCQISITIGNNSGDVSVGSFFLVDDLAFQGVATDINETGNLNPNTITLEQNYPNPFNPSTKINYTIPELSFVTLKVYDVIGNEVAALVNEYKTAGKYEIEFNASPLTSGIYFYKLTAGNFVQTKKMLLLK